VEPIVERLAALRAHGVQIAIDDFGTGYSSLAYLRNLPLDVLKVDKAFVDHVATNKSDATLAQTILSMSASMEFKTVAEGVEDGEQAAWLSAAHCGYGQGFLWSRPLPLEQAQAFLAAAADGLPQAPGGSIPSPQSGERTTISSI
jgi:sensor c-di-GMP phosphodiesterase-like protein